MINTRYELSSQMQKRVLSAHGVGAGTHTVRVVPEESLVQRVGQKLFGAIARKVKPDSLWGAQAKHGVKFELVKRDRVQEALTTTARYLPYLGVAVGLITGLWNHSEHSGAPFMETINRVKQLEIKKLALLTPLVIPGMVHFATTRTTFAVKPSINKAIEWTKALMRKKIDSATDLLAANTLFETNLQLWKAAKSAKAAFQTRRAYLGLLSLFGLSSSLYTGAISKVVSGFDPSSHFLLKSALAPILSSELTALSEKSSSWGRLALALYGAIYAATDAVLLYNTASNSKYHSPKESIAGTVMGALGSFLIHRVTKKKSVLIQ